MNRYTQPDFATSALITIDTQCDVLDGGPLEIPGTSAILPAMQRLLAAFRARRPASIDCARLLSGHAQHVTDREIILYKPRWGAFYQTTLEEQLRRWASPCSQQTNSSPH